MLNHYLDKSIASIDVPARSSASTTNSQTSYVSPSHLPNKSTNLI